jgi:signal transduction histidine kinase
LGLTAGNGPKETEGTNMVASVSHELRTPLTSLVSFIHLLRDGLGTDSVLQQREFLEIIERNADRLLRLVDDLLLLDRLESNRLSLDCEGVDLPTLLDVAVSSIRPLADHKGVALHLATTDGPLLHGDVDRLGQLVDNLLANAVKFTMADGVVRVGAEPTVDGWRIMVADTGIGIPEDEQGKLFQHFYRASNARREVTSGSGLGLVIARRIADLHCGSIVVESEENRGTKVTVELHGAPADSVEAGPEH